MQQVVHPPAILRWDPARAAVDWRLETGSMIGAYMNDEGRIYLVERDNLTILNEQSGEVLSRYQFKDMLASGLSPWQPVPIGLQGNRLYLRNYALRDNLFVYDLQTGMFGEERWNLCESGYPFDSIYLPEARAFVTFCIDFSHGMQGVLTRLSIENGTSASVEIPALGADKYMTGNGFALGLDHLAYVVDSDAGALVEIDLDSMQILR
jgi:sugar lactone lactonase YvrE